MSNAYGYSRPTAKLVCLSCRQSNIRCEPSPHAPSVACSRCARKGLMCQYVPADAPAPQPTTPTYHRSVPAAPAELPYTGPPPTNLRPRYSGGAYPDLSLASHGQPAAPQGYAGYASTGYTPNGGAAYPAGSVNYNAGPSATRTWSSTSTASPKAASSSIEDRNLFSVAYKNIVGSRRASWRVLSSIEAKERTKGRAAKADVVRDYKEKVERELVEVCDEVIALIENHLVPAVESDEAKVFFHKMLGDYHRYVAELAPPSSPSRSSRATSALTSYTTSMSLAKAELLPTHPAPRPRLNFSVFKYDILDSPKAAVELAREAFDDAIVDGDTLSEECWKDTAIILQLLRDNLVLWTAEMKLDDEEAAQ
ncbi:Zn(2)-C6 fungal-type domain-containing protein [Mycena chlorophos]|uniref:Zn(2)-C6 fungal-type domain-containing protein n=1 Tax=Mycena chlorophos TaxID=658473 RepID=A0A8H6SUN5_MYCCL|nr:Zn(2)-C6 fungal-type domain-containing protein [Mycena chlorophos]